MSLTININNLTLCHKGSDGISMATLPDVCKTPMPGGPVPIPYPNIAFSRDLKKGTTTIIADGGHMCANYGSEFCKSTGDEPGTVGGVKSGTFTKEATWITYSFDVKFENKGACRLTDKMFHNHGNTVNASGLLQRVLQAKNLLAKMVCDCDKEIKPGKDDTCLSLGNKKHECMEKKKDEHNKNGGQPKLNEERGYNYKTGKPDPHPMRRTDRFKKLAELRSKIKKAKATLGVAKVGRKIVKFGKVTPVSFIVGLAVDELVIGPAMDMAMKNVGKWASEADDLAKGLKDTIFPDGSLQGADGKLEGFFEYKFKCPPGVKSGKGVSTGDAVPNWSPGQEEKVSELLVRMKALSPDSIDPEATAELLTNELC
ncbi:DUF4150 domain-containing protein [Cystobacter ferrugineus]|uniref:Uncharacterized protein n=1 Tax=Cystobacter ferrugineus TaxID=83449 RepID=A0A1L9BJF9_9BACT|nr:DUF4150 domain-containing protein [Cystobacter ferrugineus]OJH42369.1 hypothetical protein BON30_03965 [Cystobacter ferrugineus]